MRSFELEFGYGLESEDLHCLEQKKQLGAVDDMAVEDCKNLSSFTINIMACSFHRYLPSLLIL